MKRATREMLYKLAFFLFVLAGLGVGIYFVVNRPEPYLNYANLDSAYGCSGCGCGSK